MRLNPEQAAFVDRAGTFVLANLLWVLFAVLVIPLPAATAGLFKALSPLPQGENTHLFRDFFGGMRQHWLAATLIGLIDAVVVALIVVNFWAQGLVGFPPAAAWVVRSVTLFAALALALTNLYLWPLLVMTDLDFRMLWRVAFGMLLRHLNWSFVVLLLATGPLLLILVLPAFFTLTVLFSASATLTLWGTWRVIRQYVQNQQ